jgi:hypothetical protein
LRLRRKVYHDSGRARQINIDLAVVGGIEQVHAQVRVAHRHADVQVVALVELLRKV